MTQPILYSFRRCPYAMRARLALVSAGITCALREVVLRDKPAELIEASPKATVPVLMVGDQVIDESRDIMLWALKRNDPEHWLDMSAEGFDLIEQIEGPFKSALDRYKYASRHPELDPVEQREIAATILRDFDAQLNGHDWLFGAAPRLADMATITFVRQYAMTDKAWFDAQPWPHLSRWLERFMVSDRFEAIMQKYPRWHSEDPTTLFPNPPQ